MSSAIAEALRSRLPRYLGVVVSLGLATATWLYCLQTIFSPKLDDYVDTGPPAKFTKALANHQLAVWRDPVRQAAELTRMRATNAEWDFMSRSFLVWSLANMGLQEPERKLEYLEIMDTIISATLDLEREHGPLYFLMGYGAEQPFLYSPPRSLFVDGEIALMLAARRMLEERADYRPLLQERVATMIARMQQSPVLSGESYPNESWTFCNTVALASIRAADILDGTDHSSFIRQWISSAKAHLVDPYTGLLVSRYTPNGDVMEGPEGSTIWTASHFLAFVDEDFARDLYRTVFGLYSHPMCAA